MRYFRAKKLNFLLFDSVNANLAQINEFEETHLISLPVESCSALTDSDVAVCVLLDADLVLAAAAQVADMASRIHGDHALRYCKKKKRIFM